MCVALVLIPPHPQRIRTLPSSSPFHSGHVYTQVWSVHGGQCLHELREHTHVVESVAFAPESAERTLSTAGSVGSEAGGVAKPPRANGAGGAGVAWGEEGGEGAGRGRFMASGSRDKTVKLWNASVGQCLMTFVSAARVSLLSLSVL